MPAGIRAARRSAAAQPAVIAGKVLMDQNAPDGVQDGTKQSLIDTEALIQQWHGPAGYAITPRLCPAAC
jgi:guanine deaminase